MQTKTPDLITTANTLSIQPSMRRLVDVLMSPDSLIERIVLPHFFADLATFVVDPSGLDHAHRDEHIFQMTMIMGELMKSNDPARRREVLGWYVENRAAFEAERVAFVAEKQHGVRSCQYRFAKRWADTLNNRLAALYQRRHNRDVALRDRVAEAS